MTSSFDELIKNHYGLSNQSALRLVTNIKELYANYYGKSLTQMVESGKISPSFVLSLRCDDGETLSQYWNEKRFDEYVLQQMVDDAEFEEYVVGADRLSLQKSVDPKIEVVPVGEVSADQECQVDVFQPLTEATGSGSVTTVAVSPSGTESPLVHENKPQSHAVAAESFSQVQETNLAEATEDDFITDMKAIFSGQKVFDPLRKKTIDKDRFDRPQSTSTPDGTNELPAPELKNSQAIFDRIAQSMENANAFDLGTLELENRFSDFDRFSEIEQRLAAERKSRKPQGAVGQSPRTVTVDSSDFIHDLDAISKQNSLMAARSETPAKTSPTEPEEDVTLIEPETQQVTDSGK